MSYDDIRAKAQERSELNEKLRSTLAEELDLPVEVDQIDNDQPLFGRGLELDSLDTLQIVSMLEENFATYLTDDDRQVFGSINKLADAVISQRDEQ